MASLVPLWADRAFAQAYGEGLEGKRASVYGQAQREEGQRFLVCSNYADVCGSPSQTLAPEAGSLCWSSCSLLMRWSLSRWGGWRQNITWRAMSSPCFSSSGPQTARRTQPHCPCLHALPAQRSHRRLRAAPRLTAPYPAEVSEDTFQRPNQLFWGMASGAEVDGRRLHESGLLDRRPGGADFRRKWGIYRAARPPAREC